MWEHCRLRNTCLSYEYEDRIGMHKMLVLISKSTVLHKISIFRKLFKRKTLSYMLVGYISKHTVPLSQCKRTPYLPQMHLTFFRQIFHLPYVVETFV